MKLVFNSSTITMMYGPINIRFTYSHVNDSVFVNVTLILWSRVLKGLITAELTKNARILCKPKFRLLHH